MKKTYISPELEVVAIETVSMLAASDPESKTMELGGAPINDPNFWGD